MATNLTIMALVFAAILTAIAGYRDYKNNNSVGNLILWIVAFAAFTTLSIYQAIVKEEEDDEKDRVIKKEIIDTTVVSSKRTNELVDSVYKAITDSIRYGDSRIRSHADSIARANQDKLRVEKKLAFIDLERGGVNPALFISDDKKTAVCQVYLKNSGNDIALNMRDKLYVVNYINGKLFYDNTYVEQLINKAESLPPNESVRLSHPLGLPAKNPYATPAYIYIKVDYTNSDNISMRPLKKILAIKPEGIQSISEKEYNLIADALKKEKLY